MSLEEGRFYMFLLSRREVMRSEHVGKMSSRMVEKSLEMKYALGTGKDSLIGSDIVKGTRTCR